MLDKAKTEWGLYRANQYAQDNVLKLTDQCSCPAAAACQDYSTGTVADTRTVASVTYDGVVYPTPAGTLAIADLQDFIQGVIDLKEVDGFIEVTYVGTTLTVTHVGQGTLSAITYDNASTTSLTRCCTLVSRYINSPLSVVGAVGPLVWGGNSVALDNTPYAHTATPLTDDATAAELETDLGTALTALGVSSYEVSVENDTANGEYIITLTTASGDPVKIGDVYFEVASYGQEFICSQGIACFDLHHSGGTLIGVAHHTTLMGFTTYTVKPGQTNFRPLENPLPIFKPSGFEVVFKFLPGGWCSKDDYSFIDDNGKSVLDKDRADWQKLKGITHFFSGNTKRTVMFAFAFGDEPETYKICAYTNDAKGKAIWSGELPVEANEVVAGTCQFSAGKVLYNLASEGGLYLKEFHDFKPFKIGREVGTYAGGANNSPGPFGGKAIKKMSIEIDFNITK